MGYTGTGPRSLGRLETTTISCLAVLSRGNKGFNYGHTAINM